jgi:hypothetical protein
MGGAGTLWLARYEGGLVNYFESRTFMRPEFAAGGDELATSPCD